MVDRQEIDALRRKLATYETEKRHYRDIFARMGCGYCELELIRDAESHAVDQRYIEFNQAFENMFGIPIAEAQGRTASEVFPGLETWWHRAFDEVVRTNEPARLEYTVGGLDRWFEVFAYPFGGDRVVALYDDITERKRDEIARREAEERQAFLLKLSDALRPLRDAVDIQQAAVQLLGEHLQVSRAGYYEVEPDQNVFYLTARWEREAIPLPDRMTLTDFGEEIRSGYRAGRTMIARDTEQDAATTENLEAVRAVKIRAWIGVPLVKEGRWVAAVGIHSTVPRDWTPIEIRLVEEVGERSWAAVERARAEEALHRSEARLRTLFDAIDDGYVEMEMILGDDGQVADWRYLMLNPAFKRLTGMEDVTGRLISDILPDLEPEWADRYTTLLKTGEPMRFELPAAQIGQWFDVYCARIGGADSRRMVAVYNNNVTERKRIDAILRESEAEQRLLLELVPAMLWQADPAGQRITLNARWMGYTGQSEAETQNFGWLDAIHPDDLPGAAAAFEHAFATGEPLERQQRVRRQDGEYRWHLVRHVPIRDDDGTNLRWFGAAIDVHDLHALQMRQQTLVAELQHRVRNILTVTRLTFARTFEQGGDLDEIASHFRGRLDAMARTQVMLSRNAERTANLEDMIRDELLSVAQGDSDAVRIAGPDVTLDFKTAESVGMALHELTTNALKYGALRIPGATLSITWGINKDQRNQQTLDLLWEEQGVPAVPVNPDRSGFGRELIEQALPYRLQADTKLEFKGGGVRCSISAVLGLDAATIDITGALT